VDTASAGDEIVVTNGVYQTGARAVYGMSNRVAVTKPVTVRSVNGPAVTQIVGYQVPGTTNGPEAVRCVYLTNGAALAGFTLTNGATQTSGNANTNLSGGGAWCEGLNAMMSNCVLTGNSARSAAGGAYGGTLNGCTLRGNSARSLSADGGGAWYATLNNCTVTSNSAIYGGGAYGGTLNNCVLTGNSAQYDGGGAYNAMLNNCTLTGNSVSRDGGGAYHGTLNNCTLAGNAAGGDGGGAAGGTLNNCTLTGNSAFSGGGAGGDVYGPCTLNNCLVYYNTARSSDANYVGGKFNYCCTTPLPAGTGNLVEEPQLASASHLSAGSPCRGRGSAAYASGVDVDGEPWANPPAIGCDECWSGSVTGALSVALMATYTNVAMGFGVDFQAVIGGRVSGSRWDFGDGVVVSNRPWASHVWAAPGEYVVELRAYSESHPAGVAAAVTVRVLTPPVHYVALDSGNPLPPYSSWDTAATNIQDAVDATTVPGTLVWVSDGVYQTGAQAVYGVSNRVAVTKPVTVRSVNGPAVTQIMGYQVPGTTNGPAAVRCVYLTNGAVLAGFTLTHGATQTSGDYDTNRSGGGVWCEGLITVVSNCVLTGNSAYSRGAGAYSGRLYNCTLAGNSARSYGGGAYGGRLDNCTLTGNSAGSGGGASGGTLNNCTLTGNSARSYGGGSYEGTLNNCIVYHNSARYGGANYYGGALNYCCTTPLPPGTGNLVEEPQLASASHLSAGSPCIGRGSATFAGGVDVDGESWANPPSIGCDEYWSGSVTGALRVAVVAAYTNVSVGFEVDFQALIDGRASASHWDFGDAVVVSNRPWASHGWATARDYVVELRAYNESYPAGVAATVTVRVLAPPAHYVALNSSNPVSPYSSWATAATNIQDAVDAATMPGAQVWVSNGVYQTGARSVWGTSNRVAVTKPVTVRSVNGPAVTQILGYQVPGTTNGLAAVRCVYLANGGLLAGFTLTQGATRTSGDFDTNQSGGGVWCEGQSAVVSNCVLTGNSAGYYGGGASWGTLHNCTITGNSAYEGGGASWSTLHNCTITGNSAGSSGGGAYSGTLNNCTLTSNSAGQDGGGAFRGTLDNCTLTDNSASTYGGGAAEGTLNNCTLTGNSAGWSGGGAYKGTLNNCALTGNSAGSGGGGADSATLNNCTLTGNSAGSGGGASYSTLNNCSLTGNSAVWGGGAFLGTLNNCIVYYNSARYSPTNYEGGTFSYCCTRPLPAGTGNLTNEPSFVDTNGWSNLRLQSNSPCINRGNNAYAPGPTDLDGNPRIAGGGVDIGAYEFQGAGLSGFTAWLWQYGLPTDGSADFIDPDADQLNNWQEWQADTNPTNLLSVLRVESISPGPPLTVHFPSSSSRLYTLRFATNLTDASWANVPGQTDVPGSGGGQTLRDTNAVPPRFYRVGVRMP
jgi:hypothetical protein